MAQNKSHFEATKIKQKFRELNPDNDPQKSVWLMSLDNELEEMKGGRMCAAYVGHVGATNMPITPHVFVAPRCIVEGTHRLATAEEIAKYLDSEKALAKKMKAEEDARKLQMNVNIEASSEVAELRAQVAMLMAKLSEADDTKKTAKK